MCIFGLQTGGMGEMPPIILIEVCKASPSQKLILRLWFVNLVLLL